MQSIRPICVRRSASRSLTVGVRGTLALLAACSGANKDAPDGRGGQGVSKAQGGHAGASLGGQGGAADASGGGGSVAGSGMAGAGGLPSGGAGGESMVAAGQGGKNVAPPVGGNKGHTMPAAEDFDPLFASVGLGPLGKGIPNIPAIHQSQGHRRGT